MSEFKTYTLLDDYILLCEFPEHVVDMHSNDLDRLEEIIDDCKKNPAYNKVKSYEIRNKDNDIIYWECGCPE